MSGKLYRSTRDSADDSVAADGRWLSGVPAIVAENRDPERQHRVKVILPYVDEDIVYDEWARHLVCAVLGDGFGSAFVPPNGTEVIVFGQLGQKYNLFYLPVYNEEMRVPEGFDDKMTVGFNVPGNFKIISAMLARIAAQNIEIEAAQKAKMTGQNIEITAAQLAKIGGVTVQLDGTTITINGSGQISIHGGAVAITGDSVTIHGRTVNKVGPAI
jgi:phage gp45-like